MDRPRRDPVSFTWAPWARRQRRLWGGSTLVAVLAFALLACLVAVFVRPDSAGIVLVLAASLVVFLLWVGGMHVNQRPVLTFERRTVRYAARGIEIAASWENVASIEDRAYWRERGPALVLREDSLVPPDHGLLVGLLAVVFGPGSQATERPGGRIVPLAPFVDDWPFQGSRVEAELRHHIPELVDDYLRRHPAQRA